MTYPSLRFNDNLVQEVQLQNPKLSFNEHIQYISIKQTK